MFAPTNQIWKHGLVSQVYARHYFCKRLEYHFFKINIEVVYDLFT